MRMRYWKAYILSVTKHSMQVTVYDNNNTYMKSLSCTGSLMQARPNEPEVRLKWLVLGWCGNGESNTVKSVFSRFCFNTS